MGCCWPLVGLMRGEFGADRAADEMLDCDPETLRRSGLGEGELLDRCREGHGPRPSDLSLFSVAGRVDIDSSSLSPDKMPALGLVASCSQYGVLLPSARVEEDELALSPALSSLPAAGTGREAVS